MTYSVYQHWDPLKVVGLGKSYPPELYDYIKNEKVRKVFQRIAEETEEDYLSLQSLLQKLGSKVIRVDVDPMLEQAKHAIQKGTVIPKPYFMQPRDYSIMLGETFHVIEDPCMKPIADDCIQNGNRVLPSIVAGRHKEDTIAAASSLSDIYLNGAMVSRIGKDIILGTSDITDAFGATIYNGFTEQVQDYLPGYRIHVADSKGHLDGTYCPVVPGLIVSILAGYDYDKTFPGWEVVHLENESWFKLGPVLNMKAKTKGKWWVPGEELNEDFTDYVESWMKHWVGYVEESVFDVNMLVVDQHNVIVNGYNQKVFDAFSKRGITPHICNFRHRYFWDGGLHCITTDINREGTLQDYFPERNK
jgi:N-dimethylarginine dimethylaminohydrolase